MSDTTVTLAEVPGDKTPAGPRLRTIRDFLSTEAGGAVVLLVATLTALVWANSPWRDSYTQLWATEIALTVGDYVLSHDLGHWVNDGLMALFFLLVGLELRREFDMGEFRERRRVAVPVIAALGGMVGPVLIFLALNPGGSAARSLRTSTARTHPGVAGTPTYFINDVRYGGAHDLASLEAAVSGVGRMAESRAELAQEGAE